MLEETAWTIRGLPRAAAKGGGHVARAYPRRIARILLAASVGIVVLLDAGVRRPAQEEDVPMSSSGGTIRLDATAGATSVLPTGSATLSRRDAGGVTVSRGEDDDQPAAACWLASGGGAAPFCVCSVGTAEDLLTPDFTRALLTAWRDAGSLSTSELYERLQEVDAACRREAAP